MTSEVDARRRALRGRLELASRLLGQRVYSLRALHSRIRCIAVEATRLGDEDVERAARALLEALGQRATPVR